MHSTKSKIFFAMLKVGEKANGSKFIHRAYLYSIGQCTKLSNRRLAFSFAIPARGIDWLGKVTKIKLAFSRYAVKSVRKANSDRIYDVLGGQRQDRYQSLVRKANSDRIYDHSGGQRQRKPATQCVCPPRSLLVHPHSCHSQSNNFFPTMFTWHCSRREGVEISNV